MIDTNSVNFEKGNGLIPVIAQDAVTSVVLMLGYANIASLQLTIETGNLTFYSRSKERIWTKGEESGNFLKVVSLALDCDQDTILAKVNPVGPVCHTGVDTCWSEENKSANLYFLTKLENIIAERKSRFNSQNSYVANLFAKGINKIAQKVGEEAVELIIEAKDENKELFLGEASDLLFHYLILLQAKGFTLADIAAELKTRHK